MRALARIGVCYLLLLLTSSLWRVLPFEVVAPQVAFLFATYAGMVAGERLPQVMFSVVAVGYLADLFSGAPKGMAAFVSGLVYVVARIVSSRFLVRGRGFTILFCFAMTIVGVLLVLVVRSYHGVPALGFWSQCAVTLGTGLVSAVLAPVYFAAFRAADTRFARTQRERDTLKAGYIS